MCRIHAPPFGGTLIVVRYQGCFEASLANQQNHKSIRWLLQIVEWGKSPMPRRPTRAHLDCAVMHVAARVGRVTSCVPLMAPVQAAMAAMVLAFWRRP